MRWCSGLQRIVNCLMDAGSICFGGVQMETDIDDIFV